MAWAEQTTVFVVAKRQVNFKTVESKYQKTVAIVRNPNGQDLDMKPEGQRRWNTETVYSDPDLDLKVDDMISFSCEDSQRFRVVSKTDFSKYGYIEYSLMSDYN